MECLVPLRSSPHRRPFTLFATCKASWCSLRTGTLPLDWYPRLKHGTPAERNNWRLIGGGEGIHWPELDKDLSVDGFIAGRKSGESAAMFRFWLENKKRGRLVTVEDFMKQRTKPKRRASA